ncbi:MAG: VWA domain-containing protein [Desulfobacterales bacterium]|nr:VWA domain-containing protein [Desulfobacterales bacterium]
MRGKKLVSKKKKYQLTKRVCWTLFTGFLAIIIFTYLFMHFSSQGPSPGEKFVVRSTQKTLAWTDSPFPVKLTLTPSYLTKSIPPEHGRSLDILIGLDNSISTTLKDGTDEPPIESIKKVATSFVNNTDLKKHQIGLVTLDSNAKLIHQLSYNGPVLKKVIEALPDGKGTKMDIGFQEMIREFGSTRRRPGSLGVAIILSDGRTNAKKAKQIASHLTNQGNVFIAPIGIGNMVNDSLMTDIASFSSEYAKGTSVKELVNIYKKWVHNLEYLVAVDASITENFNIKAFRSEKGQLNPQGSVRHSQIDWKLPFLTTAPEHFEYQIAPKNIGWYQIDIPECKVVLTPLGDTKKEFAIHQKPKVIVMALWLLFLLLFLLLLPLAIWLLAWWKKRRAALGPALIPEELNPGELFPLPPSIQPRDPGRPTIPTLVIGLGGTGRWILTYLKKAVLETNYGKIPETVKFLLIDTHKREVKGEDAQIIQVGDVTLDDEECLLLHEDTRDPDQLPDRLRRMVQTPEKEPHLEAWWPAQAFQNLPDEQYLISQGTRQRRVFGRLALFLDLEKGENESRTWSRISSALNELKGQDNAEPTVFVTASLSGGTGGGLFIDMGHLVRKIARSEDIKGITVQAMLALHNCFANVSKTLGMTNSNTFAAVRELDRILSIRNQDFPIQYTPDTDSEVNGPLEPTIFDNCYVFDADREKFSLIQEKPEHGVFPSIADTIHTFLYTSPGGSFDQELKQNKAVTQLETDTGGHGVVCSMGTFTIRLPMYEYLQSFKYRFAREFLTRYFDAVPGKSDTWTLKEPGSDEEQRTDIQLDEFLERDGEARTPADVLQAVFCSDFEMLLAIVEADRAHKEPMKYTRQHKTNFQRYISGFVMEWLNIPASDGREVKPDPRFRYGYFLILRLAERFENLIVSAKEFETVFSERHFHSIALELLQDYHEVLTQILNYLEQLSDSVLGSHLYAKQTPVEHFLLDILHKREKKQTQRRKSDGSILVRQYLYNDEFEANLYEDYLGPDTCAENLHRVVWHVWEQQGEMQIKPMLVSDEVCPFDSDPQSSEKNILIYTRLSELLAQDMFFDKNISRYLETEYPDTGELADLLYKKAVPLIRFEKSKAVRHSSGLFLSLNYSDYLDEIMSCLYPNFAQKKQVKRTDFLDLHVFSAVALLDSLPLPSLRPYEQTRNDYFKITDKERISQHIFRAEQQAARFEGLLPRVNEPKERLFHPGFVSHLENYHLARLFALSVIYELISDLFSMEPEPHYNLNLSSSSYILSPPRTLDGRSTTLFDAFQTFMAGYSHDNPPQKIPFDEIESLIDSKKKTSANQAASYCESLNQKIDAYKSGLETDSQNKDLISFIHLILLEQELEQEKNK